MPLLKKKSFALMADPDDLKPNEQVWQIRFTREIFRDYSDYLNRLNYFRQRIWTCKMTGKMNLTYEEALVSEQQANARARQFPEEFKAFVLQHVQYSTLKINDLVTMISEKLKNAFAQGEELLGKLENSVHPCKVMKIVNSKGDALYEVEWLGESKEASGTSMLDKNDLCRKKFPFSKNLLKLFIKESSTWNNPWVIHNSLVKLYGIATKPPCGLEDYITKHPGGNNSLTAKKMMENPQPDQVHARRSKTLQSGNQLKIEKIVYPIEDLLVKPSADDPVFSERPVPSINFLIPVDEVGNLIMIWDFLSCFGKILCLSPFSLGDFEEAIAYDGVSNVIAEAHAALLTLLINENDEYKSIIHQKKRKEMITMNAWVQYLCDFLEIETITQFTNHRVKINDGKYVGLNVHDKLEILSELLHWAIATESVKGEIDECIVKQQELKANKREEDLEACRKKREEKRLKKETKNKSISESMHDLEETDTKVTPSVELVHQCSSGSKLEVLASRRALMLKNLALDKEKEVLRQKELQKLREESKAKAVEARERILKRKRTEFFELEMEKLHIWTNSLGKDRDHSTYWFFKRDGRIFVESSDHKNWGFYSSKEELDALMSSLNPKGERELALKRHLEKYYTRICSAFQKRSKEIVRRAMLEDTAVLRRSVRVSAPPKNDSDAPSFLKYVNTWKK